MIAKTVKVTDKGQIAIPTSIRELAGIEKGDELLVVHKDGELLLKKISAVISDVEDDFKDLQRISEKTLEDIWGKEEGNKWEAYLRK